MELCKLGVIEANKGYLQGEFSAVDMVKSCQDRIEKFEGKNAVIEVFEDAVDCAQKLDEKRKSGEKLGKLAGAVILIKDNILLKGKKATAGSKFLKDFTSIYSSTVVEKMLEEDAIILGRTNMDEFSMGGDSTTSFYGITKNALDDERIAGGSSSGSTVAVSLDMCSASLGTDTAGSVRVPASYNGVVGVKSTYGVVSRNGVYAYASSFDQTAPITKNVEDSAYLLEIIAGKDIFDMTALDNEGYDFSSSIGKDISGNVFAVEKNITEYVKDKECYADYLKLLDFIKQNGGIVKEIEIENIMLVEEVYKLIAYAEASSNLARYDGLKYTAQTENPVNAEELYVKSRSEGFGKEVKKRIMLGNYILSQNGVYAKAKNLQQLIINNFDKAMEGVDGWILPITVSEAPLFTEKRQGLLLGAIANALKAPSVSIPCAKGKNGLPMGMQIIGKELTENKIYQLASFIEKNFKGVE